MLGGAPARYLSSVTGDGVEAWLDDVLGGHFSTGEKILDIDFQHYARAEAALAWLNCSAAVRLSPPQPPGALAHALLDALAAALKAR